MVNAISRDTDPMINVLKNDDDMEWHKVCICKNKFFHKASCKILTFLITRIKYCCNRLPKGYQKSRQVIKTFDKVAKQTIGAALVFEH